MIRTPRTWLWVLLTLVVGGCAALLRPREPDPEELFEQGLAALDRGDYVAAYTPLAQVYQQHWDEPIGKRALAVLAAAELDPRNPSRRLDVGADLSADYLRLPGVEAWTEPVIETMYLLALELGAAEERAEVAEEEKEEAEEERVVAEVEARRAREEARRAEVEARRAEVEAREARREQVQAAAQPLPRLPGPPVTARVRELNRRIALLERRLAECQEELERVRKTVRP